MRLKIFIFYDSSGKLGKGQTWKILINAKGAYIFFQTKIAKHNTAFKTTKIKGNIEDQTSTSLLFLRLPRLRLNFSD